MRPPAIRHDQCSTEMHIDASGIGGVGLEAPVQLPEVLLPEQGEDALLQLTGAFAWNDLHKRRLRTNGLEEDAADSSVDVAITPEDGMEVQRQGHVMSVPAAPRPPRDVHTLPGRSARRVPRVGGMRDGQRRVLVVEDDVTPGDRSGLDRRRETPVSTATT